jgi:hypothetical protein
VHKNQTTRIVTDKRQTAADVPTGVRRASNVGAYSSVTVQVPFIALEDGLFTIEGLQVLDEDTKEIITLKNSCQVYVLNE